VPTGDVEALAQAMARTLDSPLPADILRARGGEFTLERNAQAYLALFDDLLGHAHAR